MPGGSMNGIHADGNTYGPGVAFLDGRAGLARAPLSHVAVDPVGRLVVPCRADAPDPLDAIDEFVEEETARGRTVIGAIGYELRHWIEPRSGGPPRGELPLVALASYGACHTFDHRERRWRTPPPPPPARRAGSVRLAPPRPLLDEEAYRRRFERVREWIGAGDVYQVNLSIPFESRVDGDPAALYERLARRSPAPYGAYLDFGDFHILSNSPELFLERRGDRLTTRPIKGTRPRGATPAADRALAGELRRDPKERAEHVMIVDLERNDLGRIARTGSVLVEELAALESYATVHHLESTVSARLRPGLRFTDCLRAMFPGGSITGAPKIRAMQILDALESTGRGFYTGGIVHHPPDGDFTMSICIRTAVVRGDRLSYVAGGGLVADSRAAAEYRECLLKARAFELAAAEGAQ